MSEAQSSRLGTTRQAEADDSSSRQKRTVAKGSSHPISSYNDPSAHGKKANKKTSCMKPGGATVGDAWTHHHASSSVILGRGFTHLGNKVIRARSRARFFQAVSAKLGLWSSVCRCAGSTFLFHLHIPFVSSVFRYNTRRVGGFSWGKTRGGIDIGIFPFPSRSIYVRFSYTARRGSHHPPTEAAAAAPSSAYTRCGRPCSDTLCRSTPANLIHKPFGGKLVVFGPSVILA